MDQLAFNIRRILARLGWTLDDLVEATQLDPRTISALLQGGGKRPHARTLHKLAAGLGVPTDELFQDRSSVGRREFDEATNPVVAEVLREQPQWFLGWSAAHFEQLTSQFGAGGALTREGVEAGVRRINRQRDIQDKVALVLETPQGELLAELVDVLYRRVTVGYQG